MSIIFYYISLLFTWVIFFIIARGRRVGINNIMIGIATVVYSLVYDITLGEYFGLYYYIDPVNSVVYIVLSSLLLYPILNIIYTLFLPYGRKSIIIYTSLWIIGMLVFEYITVLNKTIVFTGWKPIPWSIITYIFTYSWVYLLFSYLNSKTYKKHSI